MAVASCRVRWETIHGLERPYIGHPGARPYRYNAPRLLVVEVEVIDLKGYDRVAKSMGDSGTNGGAYDDALVKQGEVHRDDPGYGTEVETQTPDGYLGEQVPALGLVQLFQIGHEGSSCHRRVCALTGA
jgi:hypothetical protein